MHKLDSPHGSGGNNNGKKSNDYGMPMRPPQNFDDNKGEVFVSPNFQKVITKNNSTELEKVSGVNALTIDLEKISKSKQKAKQIDIELKKAEDVKVSKYAALDKIKHARNYSG